MFLLLMTMAPTSADDLLLHGRKEFRTGRYAEAAKDLGAAAEAFLTPEQIAEYVRSRHYEALPLDADAAEFEPIAHQLLPEMPLPPNQALAEIRSGKHRRSDVA